MARLAGKASGMKGKKLESYVRGIKCLSCGLPILAQKLIELTDKEKIKLIRIEMRMK
jgi:hypothetical protein